MQSTPAIASNQTYHQAEFVGLSVEGDELVGAVFESCRFERCRFADVCFERCRFVDCELVDCDLSLIRLEQTAFSQTVFERCNCRGVNWALARWPMVALESPVSFYHCQLSQASFFGLQLSGLIAENCIMHEVDCREADLSMAQLAYSDLDGSFFNKTNLTKADCRGAKNIVLDVRENQLKQAKFSFPEVVSLLLSLDIEIEGMTDDGYG